METQTGHRELNPMDETMYKRARELAGRAVFWVTSNNTRMGANQNEEGADPPCASPQRDFRVIPGGQVDANIPPENPRDPDPNNPFATGRY